LRLCAEVVINWSFNHLGPDRLTLLQLGQSVKFRYLRGKTVEWQYCICDFVLLNTVLPSAQLNPSRLNHSGKAGSMHSFLSRSHEWLNASQFTMSPRPSQLHILSSILLKQDALLNKQIRRATPDKLAPVPCRSAYNPSVRLNSPIPSAIQSPTMETQRFNPVPSPLPCLKRLNNV
jgi:hypothetical protein